ncbi:MULTISPECIES: type II toxin-antitoxin system Phd/YefM family antitoxin [unclassified Endozoicomonas]|uniref:type II toxin-antitoxin system Phd/YefM family antitoxin n=1 Tax=Endozoicomonas TaxID=305899 RepID=UPI0022B40C4C|nr:type II toxin-antitoxin system prevent-host-death family antitoxin [Endozoicomonas sp. GU-1]WBA81542.1 type II toxin-antitoxin system prevent-host-death family antitoxin [Endozoicomonas sp. GU-1]WBA84494.1 type II toxin-antitoxin system prevent-host-death family antitoxin [Endozoicomonas sp. GU-1]
MKVVSYSEARNNLKSVLDQVAEDASETLIHRRDGQDAVVMSLDSYNSLMETLHLMSSPANAQHLNDSIEQIRTGQVMERGLLDDR